MLDPVIQYCPVSYNERLNEILQIANLFTSGSTVCNLTVFLPVSFGSLPVKNPHNNTKYSCNKRSSAGTCQDGLYCCHFATSITCL